MTGEGAAGTLVRPLAEMDEERESATALAGVALVFLALAPELFARLLDSAALSSSSLSAVVVGMAEDRLVALAVLRCELERRDDAATVGASVTGPYWLGFRILFPTPPSAPQNLAKTSVFASFPSVFGPPTFSPSLLNPLAGSSSAEEMLPSTSGPSSARLHVDGSERSEPESLGGGRGRCAEAEVS